MKFVLAFIIAICALQTIAAGEVWEGKLYKLENNENYGDYLKQFGINMMLRQVLNSIYPTVELKKVSADEYELHTLSTFKNIIIRFKLGQEFDENTLYGHDVKSVITLEGNTMIHKRSGNPPSEIIREFGDKGMIATMKVNDVVAKSRFIVLDS